MTIRKATEADIDSVLPLVKSFYDEGIGKMGFGFDADSAIATMKALCGESGRTLVMLDGGQIVGVLSGAIVPFMLDYSQKTFQEFIWYVLPGHRGHGLELLIGMEEVCKREGVKKMMMMNFIEMSCSLPAIYLRRKYRAIEQHWLKEL